MGSVKSTFPQDDSWSGKWPNLKLKLGSLFRDYSPFPEVLASLIISYCAWREWETTARITWTTIAKPFGILGHQEYIYLCIPGKNLITKYNLNGEIIEENTSIRSPAGIDIDRNKSLLYVAGRTHVTLLPLDSKTPLFFWELPIKNDYHYRGVKIDDDTMIYLTLFGVHQIFMCNSTNGKILNIFGNEQSGSKQGEYNYPHGLTVVKNYLYICDNNNHRIQIVTKDKGLFVSQWGNKSKGGIEADFDGPCAICYDESEKIFYIGDDYSVQLFTTHGQCIQRLGGQTWGNNMNHFDDVFSIYRINDRLYVSDFDNKRIQIFNQIE